MKLRFLSVLCCSAVFAFNANAAIYKLVDDDGHVTYSSKPIKGGKKLHIEPLPVMSPPPMRKRASESESDEDFPRVNSKTQQKRDDRRRKILEDELASEEKALETARRNLKEGQEKPEVFKNANGQTFRNVVKYEKKISALQKEVEMHENNVAALKTELSNLK